MKSEQSLLNRIAELEAQLAKEKARNDYLEEQFRLAQQKQFGQRAEGFDAQGDLFDEAEEVTEAVEANGLTPFDYIMACLKELCQAGPDIERLLPWVKNIPKKVTS